MDAMGKLADLEKIHNSLTSLARQLRPDALQVATTALRTAAESMLVVLPHEQESVKAEMAAKGVANTCRFLSNFKSVSDCEAAEPLCGCLISQIGLTLQAKAD